MGETVQCQVGFCGNQIGTNFWEVISKEHGIDQTGTYRGDNAAQLDRVGVYYRQAEDGKYVPRAVQADLDPLTKDSVLSNTFGQLFDPSNFVLGQSGADSNWAKGHYTKGCELKATFMEVLRKETEKCSTLQGFQMTHSVGGGTGSGMGPMLINKIREEYPDRVMTTFSVVPSPKVCDIAVEPYNAALSINQLVSNSDLTYCIDNEALYDICYQELKLERPSYPDVNHLVSSTMAGVTSSLRFKAQVNSDLQTLAVNMSPNPRLHFLSCGFAPLTSIGSQEYGALSVPEMMSQLLEPKWMLSPCDPSHLQALATTFRGPFDAKEVEEHIAKFQKDNPSIFTEKNKGKVMTNVCSVPPSGATVGSAVIANSPGIQELLRRLRTRFSALYRTKAYVYQYTAEGMDESEFVEAQTTLDDLIDQYEQLQQC